MRIEQGTGFLLSHLRDATRGAMLPAAFQRSYAWDRGDVEALWTSVLEGFPIGSLLQWRPDQGLPLERMGRQRLGPVEASGERWSTLLLDGQNRMASLAWSMLAPDGPRPDTTLLSPVERQTWDPSHMLVCDWRTRSVHFVPVEDADDGYRFPAYCLDDNKSFNRTMRAMWNAGQTDDEFYVWADGVGNRLREARVTSVVLDNATPAEAMRAFQHIAKVGKPVSTSDLESAMAWFEQEASSDPDAPREPPSFSP